MANNMSVSCYPICNFVNHKNIVYCIVATSTWCKWTVIGRKRFFSSVFSSGQISSNANPFFFWWGGGRGLNLCSSQVSVFSFSFAAAFRILGPLIAQCLEIWKKLIDALWIFIYPCYKICQVNLCFPVTVFEFFTGLLIEMISINGILKWVVSISIL